ncbi:MAG: hypothetical protein FWE13_04150 [Firmicutes bacterium]|nr:hypothetical protein [Bacillota bacterium]
MKTRLTKRQINILLALSVLTVALAIGIFFLPHVWGNDDPYIPVVVPPHDRFREPREAKSEYLDWEITLGGSGEEEVVASFKLQNEIIIFGNTTSVDYDFYGTNASRDGSFFVMLLSNSGQPIAYRAHQGRLEQVVMVSEIREGFLLLINTDTESFIIETNLFATDLLENDLRRSENLRNVAHERIIYLYVDDWALEGDRTPSHLAPEVFHAVMEYRDPLDGFRRLRVAVLCRDLELRYERFFTSNQSVEFVAAFAQMGEFVLFGTLRGGFNSSRLIGFRWTREASVRNFTPTLMQGVQNFTLEAIIPAGHNEFASIIRHNDGTHRLVWFYNFFSATPRIIERDLSGSSSQSVRLFGGGQNRFYVFEVDITGNGILYRFNIDNMRTMDEVPLTVFNDLTAVDSVMSTNMGHGTTFIGRKNGFVTVIGTGSAGVTSSRFIEANDKRVDFIIREDQHLGGIILVGEISYRGPNATHHMGGTNVWLARMGL